MGITVRVTDDPTLDKVLYWSVVLGLGALAIGLGYRAVTGERLLGGRTPAAWEVFG